MFVRVHSCELSRFKLLSVDDLGPAEAAATDRSDEDIGDPFLEDGFGNLTQWRLSDLGKAFVKHLEDKMNELKPKEKKQSKLEKMKWHNDRMEQHMKVSLKKYNNEANLDKDLHFEFVKGLKESLIVERGYKMYHHFNFEAMQSGTSVFLFFAEVIPDGEDCEVTCLKLLGDKDNETCHGCSNQGDRDLKHPASNNVYVGGHLDCMFPFLIDSDSEDDDGD
ncbi:hypothetical protein QOZ80_2AG0115250 [Eleusine coracana subsp. coracana]|nr:hypothetical protein QOZ80_2AG0115250 [Eleusine coracana subsp. coracana]